MDIKRLKVFHQAWEKFTNKKSWAGSTPYDIFVEGFNAGWKGCSLHKQRSLKQRKRAASTNTAHDAITLLDKLDNPITFKHQHELWCKIKDVLKGRSATANAQC